MTRKQKRLAVIGGGLAVLGLAVALVLFALRDNIVFFYSPSDLQTASLDPGARLRIGGLVEPGSVKKEADLVRFVVTDMAATIPVTYRGILPDLFEEGQGVVAEGMLDAGGLFVADRVLAKHDETYMPPEVADALKRAGHWQEDGAYPKDKSANGASY